MPPGAVPTLGDSPVPADYDGDGRTDLAVFRHSTGEWLIAGFASGAVTIASFGNPALGDRPAGF